MENLLANALGQDASAALAERRVVLERLMARLAHEIRNPLSSLNIHLQLLEEDLGALAPGTREQMTSRLGIIHGELHRLESIVDHFLRLSGPSELDLQPVELAKIVAHVCQLLQPEAATRQIELCPEVETSVPPTMADPVRLTQALMNMVINAMQAVERQGKIEIKAVAADGNAVLVVHDNGPGIPPEKMSAIFDPYFTTKPEGSGLGLWIAQQIVTAHGGTLSAQNGGNGGAVFTLVLPIIRAEGQSEEKENTRT